MRRQAFCSNSQFAWVVWLYIKAQRSAFGPSSDAIVSCQSQVWPSPSCGSTTGGARRRRRAGRSSFPRAAPSRGRCRSALEQQVLNVPQAQWEADVHHHYEADHLGRGAEIAERTGGFAGAQAAKSAILTSGTFALTVPSPPNALILSQIATVTLS